MLRFFSEAATAARRFASTSSAVGSRALFFALQSSRTERREEEEEEAGGAGGGAKCLGVAMTGGTGVKLIRFDDEPDPGTPLGMPVLREARSCRTSGGGASLPA